MPGSVAHRPERDLPLWPFLLLAALVHYVQLTILPSISLWRPIDVQSEGFDLEFVESEPAPTEEKKAEEQKKEQEKAERTPEGQVVDLPKPAEERHPENARFVSEYDTRAERETRARTPTGEPAPSAQPKAPPRPAAPPVLAMRDREPAPPGSQAPPDEQAGAERAAPPNPSGAPPNPNARDAPTMQQLRPSDEQVARAIGSPARDYLPEVEEGEDTALSSKRWRFASFFNRVKRQVAENWHPEIAYRRRDPYGNVYGFKDRITILRVKLWPDGSLKDLLLEQPSGVEFLDDEAVQAFRAAQPFLNPPRQLVDPESGLIAFRFGFIFEINSSPTFKVFRYSD